MPHTTTEALEASIEEAEHYGNHVGRTCMRSCELCEQDHNEFHTTEGAAYTPTYNDCQYCEAAWYAGQQHLE